jgi:hypothetical protein
LICAKSGYTYDKGFEKEMIERFTRLEIKLEKLETKLDGLEKQVDTKINGLQRQIDDLKAFMLWGYGMLFGGMGILIGFVIWDRRTALAPAVRKSKELEEREERIERALREYAQKEPGLAEALKNSGLM